MFNLYMYIDNNSDIIISCNFCGNIIKDNEDRIQALGRGIIKDRTKFKV